MIDCDELRRIAETNEPASQEAIDQAQKALEVAFPPDYVELLRCANGLETRSVEMWGFLYEVEGLQERNETYQIRTWLPHSWINIGNDGGSGGFFIDCSDPAGPIYKLGFGDLFVEDATQLAASLVAWIALAFKYKEVEDDVEPKKVDIYLIRKPTTGTKSLLRLKNTFRLDMSIGELYRAQTNTPFRLLHNVSYFRYASICAQYNESDPCLGLYEVDQPDLPVAFPDHA